MSSLWTYEQESWAQGCETVCGVDEAGAGPLMGPVYAAAVILPRECVIDGLNDSKKLTEKKREALYSVITETALAWSVASVSAAEIDATDILSARMKAMQMAIDGLSLKPDVALIDGNRDHGKHAAITTPHRCIVGGDAHAAVQRPFWPRSAVTATWPTRWTGNTPSTSLPSIKAMAQSCTTLCWMNTAPVRSTA